MKKRMFVFALVLLVAGRLRAGGSVDFADVRKILHQKPAIESLLLDDLIVDPAGWGVRLGNHFKHLGGARIGPYVFSAKSRAVKSGGKLEVTICTQVTFLDARGNPAKDLLEASAFREKLSQVVVREGSAEGFASCPE